MNEWKPGRHKEENEGNAAPNANQPKSLIEHIRAVDMCEAFSPPRVSQEASKYGIAAGDAMDMTTGWEFNKKSDRREAEDYVDEKKPLVLIGIPPCVAFSQLQAPIPESDRKTQQLAEGTRHMEFVAKICNKQIDDGWVLLHEQLAHARSWALPCIRNILRESYVAVVEADQCMSGLKTWGKSKTQLILAKKPTRFITNSRALGKSAEEIA